MTKIVLYWPLILLTSCQWVLTHPEEDAEAVSVVEEVAKDFYQYETKTLSPGPQLPASQPPLNGPLGPTK